MKKLYLQGVLIFAVIVILVGVIGTLFTLNLGVGSFVKGLKRSDFKVVKYIKSTPKRWEVITTEQEYNAMPPDKYIAFYKPGCKYCEASYKYLSARITINRLGSSSPAFAFVNAESEFGKKLADQYEVKYASTILVVHNGKGKLFSSVKNQDVPEVDKKMIDESIKYYNSNTWLND